MCNIGHDARPREEVPDFVISILKRVLSGIGDRLIIQTNSYLDGGNRLQHLAMVSEPEPTNIPDTYVTRFTYNAIVHFVDGSITYCKSNPKTVKIRYTVANDYQICDGHEVTYAQNKIGAWGKVEL